MSNSRECRRTLVSGSTIARPAGRCSSPGRVTAACSVLSERWRVRRSSETILAADEPNGAPQAAAGKCPRCSWRDRASPGHPTVAHLCFENRKKAPIRRPGPEAWLSSGSSVRICSRPCAARRAGAAATSGTSAAFRGRSCRGPAGCPASRRIPGSAPSR